MIDLASHLRSLCSQHGFPLVGFVTSQDAPGYSHFLDWLSRGYHGSMTYLPDRKVAYKNPESVLENCRSLIMLGMPYESHPETVPPKSMRPQASAGSEAETPSARIAHYAIGPRDYHHIVRDKLNSIIDHMRSMLPQSSWRGVVDTAPLLERDFARLAGLGWIGKNTLLLNREWGSYFFLAAPLTDVTVAGECATVSDHCGQCRACLDACPTEAFPEPHVLDASRCISYLTIEHRGMIDEALRPKMENWLFGCDVCQIVCPWNRKRSSDVLEHFRPDNWQLKTSVEHWLQLSESEFRERYRHTPFFRTKLSGMQRNALIVAANTKRLDLIELIEPFCHSDDAVLAETANWALKCLKGWFA